MNTGTVYVHLRWLSYYFLYTYFTFLSPQVQSRSASFHADPDPAAFLYADPDPNTDTNVLFEPRPQGTMARHLSRPCKSFSSRYSSATLGSREFSLVHKINQSCAQDSSVLNIREINIVIKRI